MAEATPLPSLMHQARELLSRLDLRARKSLGQHFLIDAGVLKKIVQAAELTRDDTVIEVGPGLGVLTAELVKYAGWVVAVELDDNLAAALKGSLAWANNLTVVTGDILTFDPVALLAEARNKLPSADGYKVVANLPYYITSPVLRHFLEAREKPQLMVVMVQREVAQAITARPGDMSLLSLSVQLYGEPKVVDRVNAASFYPAPEVDSTILRIRLYPSPRLAAEDTAGFFRLARAGFCAPRKQLQNSLAQGLGLAKQEVTAWLEKSGLDPRRRAETLSIEEWGHLWRVFRQEATPC